MQISYANLCIELLQNFLFQIWVQIRKNMQIS